MLFNTTIAGLYAVIAKNQEIRKNEYHFRGWSFIICGGWLGVFNNGIYIALIHRCSKCLGGGSGHFAGGVIFKILIGFGVHF